MRVEFVSVTESPERSAEELIVYTARVSNPAGQDKNDTAPRLLKYLIDHKHWSPFEMVDLTLEIETSRAIAAQILRHRSFSFQEFSQRYAEASLGFEFAEGSARRQDLKNRQNSIQDLDYATLKWFDDVLMGVQLHAEDLYKRALEKGIAKECARFLLPLSTTTRLYMKGSVRSWIHYLQIRTAPETQLEHREVAEDARVIFNERFPNVATALGWR